MVNPAAWLINRAAELAFDTRQLREGKPVQLVGGGMYRQHKHAWKGRKEPRIAADIIAVTVHQTDCLFGVSKRQLKAAGGDKRVALHKRFEATPYHVIALHCGDILDNNPPSRYTYHGDALNRDSVGFAVEARHPLLVNDYDPAKHSAWGELHVETARMGLRHAVLLAMGAGCPIREFWCHRQADRSRAKDPGELIFRDVIVPVATELGMLISDFVRGGLHVPWEWWRHDTTETQAWGKGPANNGIA